MLADDECRSLARRSLPVAAIALLSRSSRAAETPLPDAIAAPGETAVLTLHAEGAQIYECKAGADGKLAWAFREPIATLLARRQDRRPALCRAELGTQRRQRRGRQGHRQRPGHDAERHSLAEARGDFPARQRRPQSGVTTVQRINTAGGKLEGACDKAGTFKASPYSADYVFLRKG